VKDDHVINEIPAYVLGALEPAEQQKVSAHIRTCSYCLQEAKTYEETAAMLAHSVPLKSPSPDLRRRVLTSIDEVTKERVDGFPGNFFLKKMNLSAAWMVVVLVLIAFLGISNVLLWGRVQDQRAQLREDEFYTVELTGTEVSPKASAMIVVPKDDVVGTMVISQLPQLKDDLQYQLWLIRDGQRISGAVFSVDEDGYDTVYLHLPDFLDTYDTFGVTIEPFGGSTSPTGERVLQGSLGEG